MSEDHAVRTVRTATGETLRIPPITPHITRRAIAASMVGNFVEWYDFAIYGFMAPFIASQFFPEGDRNAALLSTFFIYASAFVVRPFGGAIWGRLGDVVGRQRVLVLTILVMSAGTFAIGLLPTYPVLGIWAAVLLLLCRLVQGVGASGEYSSAATFMIEYSGGEKRALRAGYVASGVFLGLVAASGLSSLLGRILGEEALQAWGWRIPFLTTALLALVAFYIRSRVEDTPEYRAIADIRERAAEPRTSFADAFRTQWRNMLLFVGLAMTYMVAGFLLTGYFSTYLIEEVGLAESDAFLASTVALIVLAAAAVAAGWLADRVGRRPLLLVGAGYFVVAPVPIFLLADLGTLGAAIAAELLLVLGLFFLLTPMTVSLADLFPVDVRATASGVSYNVATAVFGGTAPFVAAGLTGATGTSLAVAGYVMAVAVVATLVVAVAYRE
ncbi:MAG: MFS transporter [Streptosporangiales bacterium]|nr:MFS transporter [Streptosporangiales bacterium]